MKLGLFLSACLSVMVLGACSEDVVENKPAEFRIISSVHATRAPQLDANGAGKFNDDDQNSVFIHTSDNNLLKNFTYVYGKNYFWEDFRLPQEVKQCEVSACYPVVTTDTPENFAWDIEKQSNMPDFLMAAPVSADTQSSSPVVLTFSHALHQLRVILKPETESITEEMLSKAEISCRNLYPVANLNLLQGKPVSASGDRTSLSRTGKEVSFIIPEQPVENMEIVIRLKDREKVFQLSSCTINGQPLTRLEYGKSFTLNIGVNEENVFIIGQEISGWEDQGSADNTIII